MAVDTKKIQSFAWKIAKFSLNICCQIVQNHPFVSSVVLLFFLLYLFLPSVFLCLIYSSPVVICIYVYMRYYLELKRPEIKNDKRVDEKSSAESKSLTANDAVVVSRNDNKPVIHDAQMSRRKNVDKEFDAGSSNEETGMTLDTIPVDASIVGSQNVIIEEKGSASLDYGESSSSRNIVSGVVDNVMQKDLDEQIDIGNSAAAGRGEEEEESSDEEETQQDGKDAVEWTADDQQNLIDLGDSEVERNKRLESLIARRRARKLFKMAVDKRLMESGIGGQMPPLSILRNNILNIPDNQDYVEGLQFPDSAPSVLLPARNPFDIPYDPHEERPNLTGDSFHEEFTIHQKELLCRHESFFLGPSFSLESQQDQRDSHFGAYGIDKRNTSGQRFSRYRNVSDRSAHDQLNDDLLPSQEGESMSRNLSATDLVELGSQSPKESKNSEGSIHGMAGMDGEAIENSADRSEFQMDTDSIRDNISELCSLASDEASELSFHANTSSSIGNLVPKVDKHRHNLSDRVKSSRTFTIPEDIDLNGASYDSISSAFEKPIIDNQFFFRDKGPCHSPGYSIASDLQVEVSELGSPPLPIDETMSPTDEASSYDGDIDKDLTSGSEEMWGASCHLAGVDENESRSREVNEVSVDDILGAGISAMKQNLQSQIASSSLPAQIAGQQKSNTSSLSASRTEMQEEDRTHSKHPDNKVSENVQQVLEEVPVSSDYSHSLPPQIPQKSSPAMKELVSHPPSEVPSKKPEELSIPAAEEPAEVNATPENNTSASSNNIEQNCDKPAKQEKMIDPEGDPPKLNEPEDVGSLIMTTEVQEEQSATEAEVSGVNQSFDNPNMPPAPLQMSEADQISTISSSCSSPRSVLPGKNITVSSASFEPQSNLDDIVRNNSLDDISTESIILVSAPEQHLEADPIDIPSSNSGIRISEEPSVKVFEGASEPLIYLQATAVMSESNVPGNMAKEEETPNSLVQSTREADLSSSVNHSMEKEKEDKGQSVIGNLGESKNVIEDEAAIELPIPAEAETAVEKLIDQENASDQFKTIENDNHEPEDAKVVVEQSRPVESKVEEASNNEMNAAD